MGKYRRHRRTLSAVLIVLGGLFFLLAPDNSWIGVVLALIGVVLELIAFGMAHRAGRKR